MGTSTNSEAKEYFKQIRKHQINYKYHNNHDDEALELAFDNKISDKRKVWLGNYDPNKSLDYTKNTLKYFDFIHNELIHFSNDDNVRSLPSICDGLKPGQRKILFACFKKNLKNEIKVAQLAGLFYLFFIILLIYFIKQKRIYC